MRFRFVWLEFPKICLFEHSIHRNINLSKNKWEKNENFEWGYNLGIDILMNISIFIIPHKMTAKFFFFCKIFKYGETTLHLSQKAEKQWRLRNSVGGQREVPSSCCKWWRISTGYSAGEVILTNYTKTNVKFHFLKKWQEWSWGVLTICRDLHWAYFHSYCWIKSVTRRPTQ